MMKKLFLKYREIIMYIIFGLITTAVAYGVRFLALYGGGAIFGLSDTDSGFAAIRTAAISLGWVAGAAVAFVTNKKWVFCNEDKDKSSLLRQISTFCASRLGTLGLEYLIGIGLPALLIACEYQPFTIILTFTPDLVAAGVSAVVVTIANYFLSKFITFKKKKEG